jgi:hypothetical protein
MPRPTKTTRQAPLNGGDDGDLPLRSAALRGRERLLRGGGVRAGQGAADGAGGPGQARRRRGPAGLRHHPSPRRLPQRDAARDHPRLPRPRLARRAGLGGVPGAAAALPRGPRGGAPRHQHDHRLQRDQLPAHRHRRAGPEERRHSTPRGRQPLERSPPGCLLLGELPRSVVPQRHLEHGAPGPSPADDAARRGQALPRGAPPGDPGHLRHGRSRDAAGAPGAGPAGDGPADPRRDDPTRRHAVPAGHGQHRGLHAEGPRLRLQPLPAERDRGPGQDHRLHLREGPPDGPTAGCRGDRRPQARHPPRAGVADGRESPRRVPGVEDPPRHRGGRVRRHERAGDPRGRGGGDRRRHRGRAAGGRGEDPDPGGRRGRGRRNGGHRGSRSRRLRHGGHRRGGDPRRLRPGQPRSPGPPRRPRRRGGTTRSWWRTSASGGFTAWR